MNEIMLRFDIKIRKIYVHSPFNENLRFFWGVYAMTSRGELKYFLALPPPTKKKVF